MAVFRKTKWSSKMSNTLYWAKIRYFHYINTEKYWFLGRFKICPSHDVLRYDGNSRKCWVLHARNYYKQVLPFLEGKQRVGIENYFWPLSCWRNSFIVVVSSNISCTIYSILVHFHNVYAWKELYQIAL